MSEEQDVPEQEQDPEEIKVEGEPEPDPELPLEPIFSRSIQVDGASIDIVSSEQPAPDPVSLKEGREQQGMTNGLLRKLAEKSPELAKMIEGSAAQ